MDTITEVSSPPAEISASAEQVTIVPLAAFAILAQRAHPLVSLNFPFGQMWHPVAESGGDGRTGVFPPGQYSRIVFGTNPGEKASHAELDAASLLRVHGTGFPCTNE